MTATDPRERAYQRVRRALDTLLVAIGDPELTDDERIRLEGAATAARTVCDRLSSQDGPR